MRFVLVSLVLGAVLVAGCGEKTHGPNFVRMPCRLGLWEGSDKPITEELRDSTGADVFVHRVYWNSNDSDVQIETHLTVFSNWDKGMSNHPMKRLEAEGWKLVSNSKESIETFKDKTIQVKISEWERNYIAVVVLYWYQIGDRIFFDLSELEKIRSELGDPMTSSPLIKVQLQIIKTRTKGDIDSMKELASKIAKWIEKPFYH